MSAAFQMIAEKKRELEQLIKETGEAALKEEFREFFDAFPEVRAFGWKQFTPYYNDGEPCYFSVREVHFKIPDLMQKDGDYADEDTDEEPYHGYWLDSWDIKYAGEGDENAKRWKELSAAASELNALLQEQEEVMLAVFDDHVQVSVFPDRIQVDEYSHD